MPLVTIKRETNKRSQNNPGTNLKKLCPFLRLRHFSWYLSQYQSYLLPTKNTFLLSKWKPIAKVRNSEIIIDCPSGTKIMFAMVRFTKTVKDIHLKIEIYFNIKIWQSGGIVECAVSRTVLVLFVSTLLILYKNMTMTVHVC